MAIERNPYENEDDEYDLTPESTEGVMVLDVAMEADPLAGMAMIEGEDGSVEYALEDIMGNSLTSAPFDANIADYMDDEMLEEMSSDLCSLFEDDLLSRSEWSTMFVEGMDVLGLKYEKRSDPWEDACGVYSTILTEAAVRFQAETMSETFPAAGPVKTKIIGEETAASKAASERVREDMNYQITEIMTEYRPEHERLLWSLGLAGSAFKKVYFDPTLGRQISVYLPAEDVVVPYGESVIEHSERVTHVMRMTDNHISKLQAKGFFRTVDIGEGDQFESDISQIKQAKADEDGYEIILNEDGRRAVLEMHIDLVIDGLPESEDELAKPYVVTIDKSSGEILAIRRNWRQGDPNHIKQQHLVHYCYLPGFGFYGLGLIHLVGGYARAGTSIIRQLVDAGTLSNLPGGLKSRDLRNSQSDDSPIGPGEWRDVNVPSGALRDHLMPLPYKEPSQTLLALLERVTNEGRRLGGVADMNISDMSANAPVGTTLALLERILKPMSAVQARIHYAMKQEFKLLKFFIAESAPAEYDYVPTGGTVARQARKGDYSLVEVIPVSDPNSSTMAQRIVQYQTVLQMSSQAPQVYDVPYLHRQMIETIGIKNAEKIVPLPEDATPRDPVSENMGALQSKPLKAFIYQDHEAHIKAHMTFMQDPMIAQTIGQNPMAQQMMASLQAHVAEHLAYSYRRQMEEALGAQLPPPDEELEETIEINLSRLVADGGAMLTQMHQQQAAQKQAQQQAEDPTLKLKRDELAIKNAEVQRKAQKDKGDLMLRAKEQDRKARTDKVDAQIRIEEVAEDRRSTDLDAAMKQIELQNQRREIDKRVDLDLLDTFISSRPQPMNRNPEGNNNGE